MAERISDKVIHYLEQYPEFLTGANSAVKAKRLFGGYFNLGQEQEVNPQLAQSLTWRSLELTARNRAQEVLEKASLSFPDRPRPDFSCLEIDAVRRQIIIDGKAKFLAPSLFLTLSILSEHPGQVISAQDLAKELEKHLQPEQYYDATTMPTDYIRVLIQRLRKALGDNPQSPRYIETVPRVGYSLIAHTTKYPAF